MVVGQEKIKIFTKRSFCSQKVDLPNSTKKLYCKILEKRTTMTKQQMFIEKYFLQYCGVKQ